MLITSPAEVRELDLLAQKRIGLDQLIEQVGLLLFKSMQISLLGKRKVLILCGPGNNGKDAIALSKQFEMHGIEFELMEVPLQKSVGAKSVGASSEANEKEKRASSLLPRIKTALESCDLVIDGIFGTGLNRSVDDETQEFFLQVNQSGKEIWSLDIPSGLCGLTGNVLGSAIQANTTYTIETPKVGMLLNSGPKHCGKIRIVGPIFTIEEKAQVWGAYELTRKAEAAALMPVRDNSQNKSSFGRLLVMAGTKEMPGASLLSSIAAARAGCGYVFVSANAKADIRTPADFIFFEDEDFCEAGFKKNRLDAIVLGPGLGRNQRCEKLLLELLRSEFSAVLLDADGIWVLADLLKRKVIDAKEVPSSWVLTPHAGEMASLLQAFAIQKSAKDIELHRIEAVEIFRKHLNCCLLLKGYKTLVSGHNKENEVIRVIASGNRALAKAGTGDVLSGLIGSFLAQGLTSLNAASLGAYLHGKMADDWLKQGHQDFSLMASDLLALIEISSKNLKKTNLGSS